MKDTIIKCDKSTLETIANKTSLLLGEYLKGDKMVRKTELRWSTLCQYHNDDHIENIKYI